MFTLDFWTERSPYDGQKFSVVCFEGLMMGDDGGERFHSYFLVLSLSKLEKDRYRFNRAMERASAFFLRTKIALGN